MTEKIVGLDIGTFSVKAIELEFRGSEAAVTRLGQRTLAPGAVVAGEVRDVAEVSQAVRSLLRDAGIKTRKCVVGVSGTQVVVRSARFPKMSDAELREALAFEVVENLPIPESELVSDFQRKPSSSDGGEEPIIDVLLAGAHDREILNTIHAVQKAGLSVIGIEPTALSAARGLRQIARYADQTAQAVPDLVHQFALVDVGAGVTTLTLASENGVEFVRTVASGGDIITARIAEAVGCSLASAEFYKRGGHQALGLEEFTLTSQVEEVLCSSVAELVNDISSSLEYYLLQSSAPEIASMWLTGGGSLIGGLDSALAQRQGVEVLRVDMNYLLRELEQEAYRPDEGQLLASSALAALGLGLWRQSLAKGATHEITLLPRKHRERSAARKQVVMGALALTVLGGGLGALYVEKSSQLPGLNSQVASLQSELAQTRIATTKYKEVSVLGADVMRLSGQIKSDTAGTFSWAQLLAQIAQVTPRDAWITQFSATSAAAGSPASVTFGLMGCSQVSPSNWLQQLSHVQALANEWVSTSSLAPAVTGSPSCPGLTPSGPLAPQYGVTTFSSSATVVPGYTTDRFTYYVPSGAVK